MQKPQPIGNQIERPQLLPDEMLKWEADRDANPKLVIGQQVTRAMIAADEEAMFVFVVVWFSHLGCVRNGCHYE